MDKDIVYGGLSLRFSGLHRLLNPRRRRIQAQQRQSEESKDKGLPGQGTTGRCIRPVQRLYGFCRLRSEEERRGRYR